MPFTSQGRNDVIQQVSERFETDRYGVDTVQLNVEIPDALFPSALPSSFASHPRFLQMALSRRSGNRSKPGWWSASYTYEGFLTELPEPIYELSAGLDQEPIQAHPDFVTAIGGKPSAPLNGAIFIAPATGLPTEDDAVGVFREFAATIGSTPNEKGGIESYLVPGAEWRVTEFSTTRPTGLRNLGTIASPDGANPTLSGRNWLLWSQIYTRRGSIYQVSSTWKLSGRRGWDSDIY